MKVIHRVNLMKRIFLVTLKKCWHMGPLSFRERSCIELVAFTTKGKCEFLEACATSDDVARIDHIGPLLAITSQ